MITPPDETYSTAEAAQLLRRCERQTLRYLTAGRLNGSRASGRWTVTALAIWRFQGVEQEMMALWSDYCRHLQADRQADDVKSTT